MAQRFSRQQDEGGTFLAKGVAMQRIAKMDGIVRIDGPFNGVIYNNHMIIIGEHAVFRGSIVTVEMICGGRIEVYLTARKRIQLLSLAFVIAEITTPSFSVEEGVYFQGKSEMGDEPKSRLVAERFVGFRGGG
ncbi:MAG: polymer-forming cytoskeletal protein [Nitrospirota bacterium]|nr:polymer-forming cytoskeletal protein [Nitrospirota bacterium]MDH5585338.1 polymer-forming cytoskeletal protein [Nitrospirota bacterium]